MMKRIADRLKGLIVALLLVQVVALPAPVYAGLFDGAKSEACKGAALQETGAAQCDGVAAAGTVNSVLVNAINLISWVVGVISVIAIIIGGLRFILAQGDSAGVAAGKNTIIYAIVGLVIVAFAQVIVRFVLSRI